MFLAIHEADLPFTIAEPDIIRKRLLGQDKVGIIPIFDTPRMADEYFYPEEDVFEVLYYKYL